MFVSHRANRRKAWQRKQQWQHRLAIARMPLPRLVVIPIVTLLACLTMINAYIASGYGTDPWSSWVTIVLPAVIILSISTVVLYKISRKE